MPTTPPPTFPALRPFAIQVFRNRNATDQAQVPAAGALIEFFKQGATVRTALTVGANGGTANVQVWHSGTVEINDTLRVDVTSRQLAVTGTPTATSIPVRNDHPTDAVSLTPGQRLLRLSDRPIARQDPNGLASTDTASQISADANYGRAFCYLREFRYDHVVTILDYPDQPPPAPRVFPDTEGSYP